MQIAKSFTPIDPATLSPDAAALLPKVSRIRSYANGSCQGLIYQPDQCCTYLPNIYETDTIQRAAARAQSVSDTLARLKAVEAECRAYLELLAARVRQLEEAAPLYSLRLSLVRYRGYGSNAPVSYTLRVDRVYPERFAIDPQPVLEEIYKGSERRVALKRLDELRRAYPGIDEHIDIEKKAWETR